MLQSVSHRCHNSEHLQQFIQEVNAFFLLIFSFISNMYYTELDSAVYQTHLICRELQSQVVICCTFITTTYTCQFRHVLGKFSFNILLKENSPAVHVYVQSMLVVIVVSWSNKFLILCYIDRESWVFWVSPAHTAVLCSAYMHHKGPNMLSALHVNGHLWTKVEWERGFIHTKQRSVSVFFSQMSSQVKKLLYSHMGKSMSFSTLFIMTNHTPWNETIAQSAHFQHGQSARCFCILTCHALWKETIIHFPLKIR